MGWSSFQSLAWQPAPMPYSSGSVDIARLPAHASAFLAFVRFPAGWSRTQPVVYQAVEEFVILEGELRIDDQRWIAPAYGCIGAGSIRSVTESRPGCLAWARFHGSPRALKAEAEVHTAPHAIAAYPRSVSSSGYAAEIAVRADGALGAQSTAEGAGVGAAAALEGRAGALRETARTWSDTERRLLRAFPAGETWLEPSFQPGIASHIGQYDAVDLETFEWRSSAAEMSSHQPGVSASSASGRGHTRPVIVHRISETLR
ncbi:MAG: hypothetical protein ACKODB_02425 [Betaproteobacteria bacterium]